MSDFFSFLIKAFVNFEKFIRFHRKAFIVYKNGENLKILKEIFHKKLITSDVILVVLDLKFSSSTNHGGGHSTLPFQNTGSAPGAYFTPCSIVSIVNFEHVMAGWERRI